MKRSTKRPSGSGRVPDRRGNELPCPVRHDRRIADALHEEHERVIAIVVREGAGRIKVMAGTGSNSTAEALRLTSWAAKEGADAASWSLPITTSRPKKASTTLQGDCRTGRLAAGALQHPRPNRQEHRAGDDRAPGRAADITMVKEATGSLDQASQIIAVTNLTVLTGDDSLTLPLLAVGGEGSFRSSATLSRRTCSDAVGVRGGDLAEARRWHHKLFPLCRDMLGLSTNPIPLKAAMKMLGHDTANCGCP